MRCVCVCVCDFQPADKGKCAKKKSTGQQKNKIVPAGKKSSINHLMAELIFPSKNGTDGP